MGFLISHKCLLHFLLKGFLKKIKFEIPGVLAAIKKIVTWLDKICKRRKLEAQ